MLIRMGSGRFCTVCGTVWKVGTWRCVFACTSTVRSLIRDTLLENDQDSCTVHDQWYGSVDNLFHGALLDTLLWNQSHNFNDLLFDLRANSIVACVSRSGRNYRRLPFLRKSINFFQTFCHRVCILTRVPDLRLVPFVLVVLLFISCPWISVAVLTMESSSFNLDYNLRLFIRLSLLVH